ncbi:hypothetical protein ABZS84_37795 [Streptomyces sp. NPDC005481]|uniref:hypothetical protein n=1 Tax=Streptomyces sp. NPDC005481 TaxID=3154881 RepID=UPI0033A6D161
MPDEHRPTPEPGAPQAPAPGPPPDPATGPPPGTAPGPPPGTAPGPTSNPIPGPPPNPEQRRLAEETKNERYVWWYLAYFLFGIHIVAFVMIYAVMHAK